MKERELGASDTSSMKARSDMQQTSSETISIASSLDRPAPRNYEFAEFDKLYDPYKVITLMLAKINGSKVRQEIEKKYTNKSRSQMALKAQQRPSDEYKYKNIEKNFF